MSVLNLGCGHSILEGAVNHDLRRHCPEVDVAWDLNKTPWPWKDGEFDQVKAVSVFEHLKLTLVESLDECWRILRPRGVLHVKFPLFTSPNIHNDPTHRWFWSLHVLDFVDPTTKFGKKYEFYTDYKWKILERKSDKKGWNCYARLVPLKEGNE